MPAKKNGRVTPKGTQPKSKSGSAARRNLPNGGRDGQQSAPGSAASRGRPDVGRANAPFRHRSR